MKSNSYIELTLLAQQIKKKKKKIRLDVTQCIKLDFNLIPIWNLIEFSLNFTYYYIYKLACNPMHMHGYI